MKRTIVCIDDQLCNGCGECITTCHEKALQLIDGKARIVSELYCDGMGACIRDCPVGAITLEIRDALPYNERTVIKHLFSKGVNTYMAHLRHLKYNYELEYLEEAIQYLKEQGIVVDVNSLSIHSEFDDKCTEGRKNPFPPRAYVEGIGRVSPCLPIHTWPIQLHLINVHDDRFQGANIVLAADCTAFVHPCFYETYGVGNTLAIACPKLDIHQDRYTQKLVYLLDTARIRSLTVIIMQTPCCNGLLKIDRLAVESATHRLPIRVVVLNIEGGIVTDELISEEE